MRVLELMGQSRRYRAVFLLSLLCSVLGIEEWDHSGLPDDDECRAGEQCAVMAMQIRRSTQSVIRNDSGFVDVFYCVEGDEGQEALFVSIYSADRALEQPSLTRFHVFVTNASESSMMLLLA